MVYLILETGAYEFRWHQQKKIVTLNRFSLLSGLGGGFE